MSYLDGSTLYLDEFDETLDALMVDFIFLIKDKIMLAKEDEDAHIEIWVNSLGGDSHKAFALVELIEWAKTSGVRVNTVVLSEASSSGSIVACAGSRGYRRTSANASYMMHYGDIEIQASSPLDLQRQADAYQAHFDHIINHYVGNSNKDFTWWSGLMKTDNFTRSGSEAVDLGLADGYL